MCFYMHPFHQRIKGINYVIITQYYVNAILIIAPGVSSVR